MLTLHAASAARLLDEGNERLVDEEWSQGELDSEEHVRITEASRRA